MIVRYQLAVTKDLKSLTVTKQANKKRVQSVTVAGLHVFSSLISLTPELLLFTAVLDLTAIVMAQCYLCYPALSTVSRQFHPALGPPNPQLHPLTTR